MIVVTSSTQIYFREALNSVLSESNIRVTDSLQVYVVHLLNEFLRSEKAFAGINHGEKLVMSQLFERAFASEDREALQIYRHLGDSSLYLLGFFKESKAKGMVSITYYKDMGSTAYSLASDLSRAYAVGHAALFQELSERFSDLVTILENIANYGDRKNLNLT